jgi:hypothetical protein
MSEIHHYQTGNGGTYLRLFIHYHRRIFILHFLGLGGPFWDKQRNLTTQGGCGDGVLSGMGCGDGVLSGAGRGDGVLSGMLFSISFSFSFLIR